MGVFKWLLVILFSAYTLVSCVASEWWQAKLAKDEAERQRRATPSVVSRSSDGCTVYTFAVNGTSHFFTRCGTDEVSTTRHYSEPCGKNQRCSRQETVRTVPGGE